MNACRPGAREVTDVAARFLLDSVGHAFCHSCLAGLLHVGFDEVRKVVGQLRMRAEFRLGTGPCSVCEFHRITLAALNPSARQR